MYLLLSRFSILCAVLFLVSGCDSVDPSNEPFEPDPEENPTARLATVNDGEIGVTVSPELSSVGWLAELEYARTDGERPNQVQTVANSICGVDGSDEFFCVSFPREEPALGRYQLGSADGWVQDGDDPGRIENTFAATYGLSTYPCTANFYTATSGTLDLTEEGDVLVGTVEIELEARTAEVFLNVDCSRGIDRAALPHERLSVQATFRLDEYRAED
ncbi:MAG: hypothetical protein AAF752_01535 [Bacteroidota bacterium]